MSESDQPPPSSSKTGGLRHWRVAGGVVIGPDGVLLVENLRRNGRRDWSPPGGVIELGESAVEGLTREVEEETGLRVASWRGPVYRVEVTAPDDGFFLEVEVHRAQRYEGDLHIDDPDGIVVDVRFVDPEELVQKLGVDQPWISEPLLEHLDDDATASGAASALNGKTYRYNMTRDSNGKRRVVRLDSHVDGSAKDDGADAGNRKKA